MRLPFLTTEGRDVQAEGLSADCVEVRQFGKDIVRELGPMLAYRFEDLCAELILDVLMLCDQVKGARESIRRSIHPSEDERPMQRRPSISAHSQLYSGNGSNTHAICPRSSSSGSLSSSFALMFAWTEKSARQAYRPPRLSTNTHLACS